MRYFLIELALTSENIPRHTDDKPEDWCCGGEEWAMFQILTSSIYYVTKSAKTESFANTFGQESQCQ